MKNAGEFRASKFVIFAVFRRWKLTDETELVCERRNFQADDAWMKLAVRNALDVVVVDEPNQAVSVECFHDRRSVEA